LQRHSTYKKMKLLPVIIFCILIFEFFAQSFPIVVYDVESEILDTIPSFEIDIIKTFDYTLCDHGYNDEKEIFEISSPDNTFNNAGFTDFLQLITILIWKNILFEQR